MDKRAGARPPGEPSDHHPSGARIVRPEMTIVNGPRAHILVRQRTTPFPRLGSFGRGAGDLAERGIERRVDHGPGRPLVARRVDRPRDRRNDPLHEACLGGDPLRGLVRRRATPDQPGSLAFPIARDEPDLVAQAGQPPSTSLIASMTTATAPSASARDAGQDPRPDGRVDDRLEVAQSPQDPRTRCGRGPRDPATHQVPERRAETGDDRVERGLAAVDDLARDDDPRR